VQHERDASGAYRTSLYKSQRNKDHWVSSLEWGPNNSFGRARTDKVRIILLGNTRRLGGSLFSNYRRLVYP